MADQTEIKYTFGEIFGKKRRPIESRLTSEQQRIETIVSRTGRITIVQTLSDGRELIIDPGFIDQKMISKYLPEIDFPLEGAVNFTVQQRRCDENGVGTEPGYSSFLVLTNKETSERVVHVNYDDFSIPVDIDLAIRGTHTELAKMILDGLPENSPLLYNIEVGNCNIDDLNETQLVALKW